jgi:hypothetical protein
MSGLSAFLNVADFSLSWLSVQRFHTSIGGHKLANPLTANIKSLMMSDFLESTSKGVCLIGTCRNTSGRAKHPLTSFAQLSMKN